MLGFIRKKQCTARCYNVPQTHVQSGLSMSPAQMSQLSEHGVPISSQVLGAEYFDDGVVGPLTDVPFLNRRGIDASDVYDYQVRSRQKVQKYVNSLEGQN